MGETHTTTGGIGKLTSLRTDEEGNSTEAKFPNPSSDKKLALPRLNIIFPYFHTDACQAPGYLDLNVERLGVDLLTINGSKIYGPKGISMLYVKDGVKIQPLLYGGEQERKLRPGTENVPYSRLSRGVKNCRSRQRERISKAGKVKRLFYKQIARRNFQDGFKR